MKKSAQQSQRVQRAQQVQRAQRVQRRFINYWFWRHVHEKVSIRKSGAVHDSIDFIFMSCLRRRFDSILNRFAPPKRVPLLVENLSQFELKYSSKRYGCQLDCLVTRHCDVRLRRDPDRWKAESRGFLSVPISCFERALMCHE